MKKEEHRRMTIEPECKKGQKFKKFQRKFSYVTKHQVIGQKGANILGALLTFLQI